MFFSGLTKRRVIKRGPLLLLNKLGPKWSDHVKNVFGKPNNKVPLIKNILFFLPLRKKIFHLLNLMYFVCL